MRFDNKWSDDEISCMQAFYFSCQNAGHPASYSYDRFKTLFPGRSLEAYCRAARRYGPTKTSPKKWYARLDKAKRDKLSVSATSTAEPTASASVPAAPVEPVQNTQVVDLPRSIIELQKPFNRPFRTKNDTTGGEVALKILTLSDIHFPLTRLDILQEAIEANLDADVLVLNGDIVEAYAFSKYSKSRSISAMTEYMIAFDFIEHCSKLFPKVYLIDGNHEARVSRHLTHNGIHKDTVLFYGSSILGRIANGEKLDKDGRLVEKLNFTNVFYDSTASWYVKIGKTIFAHPHARGSGVACAQLKKAGDYFSSLFGNQEVDCVVIGHTHKQSKIVLNHLLLIEQGAFATPASYAYGADLNFTGGTQNGYAVVCQDKDGNCIRNSSGFFTFGTATPLK